MTAPAGIPQQAPAAVAGAAAALRAGRPVLVAGDGPDGPRGYLVLAAEHVTAGSVNTLTSLGRGLLHVALRCAALDALGIPPADPAATGPGRDRYRLSVGPAGAGPGSAGASVRARTARALADPAARPADFTRPGHVFPLGCAAGGVLELAEHPEAAVDLVEQAGMAPAAALVEVCGADGEPAGPGELRALAAEHDLPVVEIAALIAYRRRELCRVRRRGVARLPLPPGDFRAIGFTDGLEREHVALVHGDPATGTPLVRLHFECLLGDVLGSGHCGCRDRLERALAGIAGAGDGVLVYVRAHSTAVRDTLRGCAPGTAAHPVGHSDLLSAYDILDDLGLREIRLLADAAETHPAPAHVRVVARVPLPARSAS